LERFQNIRVENVKGGLLRFVINLSVIRCAWTGTNPSGAPEQDSAILFLQIIRRGHKIIVTKEIEQKYLSLFNQLRKGYSHGPSALNAVKLYFFAKQMGLVNNTRYSSDLPPLPDESHIKEEDRDFARLANLTQAMLVTHDEPLIIELESKWITAVKPGDPRLLLVLGIT